MNKSKDLFHRRTRSYGPCDDAGHQLFELRPVIQQPITPKPSSSRNGVSHDDRDTSSDGDTSSLLESEVTNISATPGVAAHADTSVDDILSNCTTDALLQGEVLTNRVRGVSYAVAGHTYNGELDITNYRLMVHPSAVSINNSQTGANVAWLSLPLACIRSVEQDEGSLSITTKDLRSLKVTLHGSNSIFASTLCRIIKALAFPTNPLSCFAFTFGSRGLGENMDGWNIHFHEIKEDYERIGLCGDGSRWRLFDNSTFELVSTYPDYFAVPASMSIKTVITAARFRSKHRMPAAVWRHMDGGAVLLRSAQPLAGIPVATCPEDEKLLELIRTQCGVHEKGLLTVVDARGAAAALGNQLTGKGVEMALPFSEGHDKGISVVFGGIGNIHTMRKSWDALGSALSINFPQPSAHVLLVPVPTHSGSISNGSSLEVSSPLYLGAYAKAASTYNIGSSVDELAGLELGTRWLENLQDSQWLSHVRRVLAVSMFVARSLQAGVSILTHCSDGWDRTAQLCATAELLLDPYYRTLRGFAVLIEKEWISFGHKFQDRCGFVGHSVEGSGVIDEYEFSPVFVQWLDVIWQILRQFPTAFEFNEEYLVFIAEHCYSCLFGTFLFNNMAERLKHKVHLTTTSIWSVALSDSGRALFVNPAYEAVKGLLPVSTIAHRIGLFESYFCKWEHMCQQTTTPS